MSEFNKNRDQEAMNMAGLVQTLSPAAVFASIASSPSFQAMLEMAMNEDLSVRGDVTSSFFSLPDHQVTGHLVVRDEGVIAGLGLIQSIAERYHPEMQVALLKVDGDRVMPGDCVATIQGWQQDVLGAERVILNFVGYLSGIATQTAIYVDQIKSSKAQILDTRKTLPGWRYLSKAAVRCGGGTSHRMGLYDAMLIKDNHLHGLSNEAILTTLDAAMQYASELDPKLKFIMVEVDTLKQLKVVLQKPVDIVLLDNMPPEVLLKAVAIRDEMAPKVLLEASGGVTLETVKGIAEAGVDRISIGALTHSVKNFDIGLDMK